MSRHGLFLRTFMTALGPLPPAGAMLAQQVPSAPSCSELRDGAPPAPTVTATPRQEYLKDGRTLIQDIFLSSPDGTRIRAFVIRPYKPAGDSGGAAFFLHCLVGPPANARA